MRYKIVMFFLRAIMRVIARVTVYGMENLPPSTSSYVGVANHIGRIDPALVFYMLHRNDIIMLVAEKYRENFITRIMVQMVDGIFVDRYNADLGALREVFRRMKKGGVVVIAPESTRSPTGALQQGWDGASYIAAKSGLPIVPVGATGSWDQEVVDHIKHLKRLDVIGRIGPAFTLPPLDNRNRDEQLARYTEEIMCRIAAELPEPSRGVYKDHPRLQELLASKASQPTPAPQVFG